MIFFVLSDFLITLFFPMRGTITMLATLSSRLVAPPLAGTEILLGVAGNRYLRMLQLFAHGLYNFIVEPLPPIEARLCGLYAMERVNLINREQCRWSAAGQAEHTTPFIFRSGT
jgi:hypothetical protein